MTIGRVKFGIALVTAKGLQFNEKLYTNSQMIRHQWFEHAAKYGEWECPIGYIESNLEFIVLFDKEEMEVASSIELNGTLKDENVIQAYYEGINNLKARLISIRDDKK
ncbi:hypothetical protein FHS19_006976 [Paenibacillus rhizosphaerae]|uniref:Uncharacterized protein n=1 Tax=Paenibacillus rhizosphaerae TaxID=297318 RepID=A0A839U5Z8_9BACL|nr:hypothetical protein [Paenibacillus rhizosphaerae]MBB3132247.1 hypothetical protein [Paenibacillus rhizosphaerae]